MSFVLLIKEVNKRFYSLNLIVPIEYIHLLSLANNRIMKTPRKGVEKDDYPSFPF